MTRQPAAATPAGVLTSVSYDSPDARRLTQALHRDQIATYYGLLPAVTAAELLRLVALVR